MPLGIGPQQARALVPVLTPEACHAALVDHGSLKLDTNAMLQAHVASLRAAGGQLVTGAQVNAITRDADSWWVATSAGDFTSPVLVNAAGAWADIIAQMAGIQAIGLLPFPMDQDDEDRMHGNDERIDVESLRLTTQLWLDVVRDLWAIRARVGYMPGGFALYPDLVVNGADGQVETVQYQKLTPMLLNEVQKQNRQLQDQNRQQYQHLHIV